MLPRITNPKVFPHASLPDVGPVIRLDGKTCRLYSHNGEKYPSITTVLSVLDTGWLDEWKERVGEERAAAVSHRASTKGTSIHDLCEVYLKNQDINSKLARSLSVISGRFMGLVPILDKIEEVYGSEIMMVSHDIKISGTADAIVKINGVMCVIDFKTSGYPKTKGDIPSYFIQLAAYAKMFKDMYHIDIKYGIIIMSVENMKKPLLFKEDLSKWEPKLLEVIDQYYAKSAKTITPEVI